MTLTPTQQELNVRFAEALGWKSASKLLPNYFAPENFHLVRQAVGELKDDDQTNFFYYLELRINPQLTLTRVEITAAVFLSPIEHIITAYLKVKEAN